MQDPASPPVGNRRRGDAFDPSQNPNAPGAPKALGGGQMPIGNNEGCGRRARRRAPGEPLDLSNTSPRTPGARRRRRVKTAALTTLPPSAHAARRVRSSRIGYIQRKDYALAEETMKNFGQKYPNDPLLPDSHTGSAKAIFSASKYRDAAEAFLGVTTKYDKSGKAPDAFAPHGQSLAALKEKEAACARFWRGGAEISARFLPA